MILPGLTAIFAPVLVGYFLGVEALGGMLAGATVTGVLTIPASATSNGSDTEKELGSATAKSRITRAPTSRIVLRNTKSWLHWMKRTFCTVSVRRIRTSIPQKTEKITHRNSAIKAVLTIPPAKSSASGRLPKIPDIRATVNTRVPHQELKYRVVDHLFLTS